MTRITTQPELDVALAANPDGIFEIEGSALLSVTISVGKPLFKIFGAVKFEAYGNATVRAYGNATVQAFGNATVRAFDSATVRAYGNATVEAYGNATVQAFGNATVEAFGNAKVEAFGNAFLRVFSALKITATASVVILKHGPADSIEGGRQLDAAPEPTDRAIGAEWAEFYGIELDAPFKVENIDARIAAAIEQERGIFDMGGWHGRDDCDETNWCNTTHCRAGYAVCLAGKEGFELERKYGAETAGRMIYAVSRPDEPLPDFFADTDEALEDIEASAARQATKDVVL